MVNRYVSIIVPTYREWDRLEKCINALVNQSYPQENFEVIIVNNDPKDSAPDKFFLPANFTLIAEGQPGSYAARNAALKIAKGEIIGFTDSDCIPHKDWIKNAVEYLAQNQACSRIAGNVTVFSDSSCPSIGEKYDTIYAFPQKRYTEKFKSGVTANLFTYRYVFDKVGGFDDSMMSFGDISWGGKAHKAGFEVHYVESVKVYHPARRLNELIKKERRVGGGKGLVQRGRKNRLSNFINLINGFRPRMAEIKYLYSAKNDLNAIDKVKVLLLRHYLLNVRNFELLRVQLGKKPNRN